MMKPKKKMFFILLAALITLLGITPEYMAAAPADLITVTVNTGDVLTTVLNNAAGGDRNTIKSLKLISNGYSISSSDFTTLRDMATAGIGQLTYLDLADAVCMNNGIPGYAFDTNGNTILQTVVLPSTITSIGCMGFGNCSNLTGILTIPNSVKTIDNYAFMGCSGFTGNLTIPNSVTSIGVGAFENCSGFTGSLIIPDSITTIQREAFTGCSGFNGGLTISNNITMIDSSTFAGCSGFTGVLIIPNNITSIGVNAFLNCSGFTGSLIIPNSVINIGNNAFYNCSGFTGGLTIPNSITTIGSGVFDYCSGLTGDLILPDSVINIGSFAFANCIGFTGSLTLPKNITNISDSSFQSCNGFTGNLLIPNTVKTIGNYAFYGCSNLTGNLTIPNGVTTIGNFAFFNCSRFNGSLTIPDSVTSIGEYAFYSCSSLTGTLTLPNNITSISYRAFYNCSGFTGNLTIPSSVTTIGEDAFWKCRGFTGNLIISNSVTSIGNNTFYNCNGFTGELIIPNNVANIGNSAFEGCSGFTGSLIIPNGINTIGNRAFYSCRFSSFTYHGSLIGNIDLSSLFGSDDWLTSIDLSNATGISTVNASNFINLTRTNFDGMTNLTSVSINGGKIDFSGGAEGAWYDGFTGTKNISGQRPEVNTKKDYPSVSLNYNDSFTVPAPVWVTGYNIDISTLTTAAWLDQAYVTNVKNRFYTLSYIGPDGNSKDKVDTTIPGNYTVSYTFSGYSGANYSRQYVVGTFSLAIASTHIGNFTQGQNGATYTIAISNNGTSPTSGVVTVEETLPSGLTATSFSGAGWTCNLATLTASRSDRLEVGSSYPELTLTVNVNNNAPESLINTVKVSYGVNGSLNSAANDPTTINQLADLTITKTHTGSFTQGQTGAVYTIKVTNNGAGATSGTVTVTDTLPAGLTATGISGTGWTCDLATLTATRNDVLASGGSYPDLIVTVNVATNAPASVTNTASVSGGGDLNTTNNSVNDPTTINQLADLTITKTHTGSFTQGQTGAVYTIKVTNNGAGATTGTVTVTDTLPAGLTATGISGTGWTCDLATLTATRNDVLAAGGTYPDLIVTVNVAANAPASVTNTASVSGGGDLNTTNNSVNDPTTINQLADLTITKTHTGSFTQGQTGAIYTIKVTNNGTGATSGTVTVTDTLPAGLTATGISGTGWTCNLATLTATRNDVLVAGGTYPDLIVTVNVATNAPASVTNTASVSGGGDLNTTNNSVNNPTTINQLADLTITKTHTGSFTQGQTSAVYTIKVTNNGTGATSGTVTVTDTLPAGLTATGISGTGWTCDLATLTATRNDVLAAGGTYSDLIVSVNVAANAPASVTNTASVSGGGDLNTTNNSVNDPTTINQLADLTITKTHTGSFTQGQTGAIYTIKVTNNGTGATSGTVTVTDTLPAGLTATGISGTGWTCNLATLTATRNDVLASGGSYPDLIVTVNVAANAPASVTNTASVSGGVDLNATNNSVNDPTTVNQLADLTITKTHTGGFTQGQTGANYTIKVTNNGAGATSGIITVTDTLPAGLTATGISGTGWTCDLATLTATRNDVLASGGTYPELVLTVNVAANAPASVTNTASVSGGGEVITLNNSVNDITTINRPADLIITKTHTSSFMQGQTGAIYTIKVTNNGAGATSGTVTVTDTLPAGLTATGISGTGWTCGLATLTATRNDVLASGGTYPDLIVTVNVAANAPAIVTNIATVSGGGEIITENNTASDPGAVKPNTSQDLLIVTVNTGDVLADILDNAVENRNTIKSLKIISNGYYLSSSDFTILRDMATNGVGQLTYLDLMDAVCDSNMIPAYAFDSNGNIILKTIVLPSSITSIGYMAFHNCSSLTGDLTIPNNVKIIADWAFFGCSSFNGSLSIPSSVTSIGDGAFCDCSGFTGALTIPDSVISIGMYAFCRCGAFTGSLVIPDSVTSIGDATFKDCKGFTGSLTISNGVTSIGNFAFAYCSGFTGNLIIPNSVTTIGDAAFSDCNGFTGNLFLSNSVTTIGNCAFLHCSGFCGALTIPDSVTSLGEAAFSGCGGFTGSLSIPNNITSISASTFAYCSGLTGNLTIPDNVKTIGNNAFDRCGGFTGNLTLPDNLTSIGDGAFYICNFTGNLILPNSLTSIGIWAFYSCTGFSGNLTIPDNVTNIGNYAFGGCSGFTGSLTISRNLTTIKECTFLGCNGFTGALTIPSNVTDIGNGAFENCSGFTGALTIPSNVTVIGSWAFENCSGFTGDLTIPGSVKSVAEYAFYGCSGLSGNLTIPDSVLTIGNYAFFNCRISSFEYHGSHIDNIDLSGWFGMNDQLLSVNLSNATAVTMITANEFDNLTSFNFDGMTNLTSVSINGGKIDFSGGAEGAWYDGFTGTKNISGQRPEVNTKKDNPSVSLNYNASFTVPAPVWVTGYNTDISTLTTAAWLDQSYVTNVKNRFYTLSYIGPDGNSKDKVDTTIPGNCTVSYTFSGYSGANYSRQYVVGTFSLAIASTHIGNFTQGQNGATYIIAISNNGTSPTSGVVTVEDTLPSGLVVTGFSGTGWNCNLATMTASRNDVLDIGSSYPELTLTVNVNNNAPESVINTVKVSYGVNGSLNSAANDPTTVNQLSDLTITKTHTGSFTQGQTGAVYTIKVINNGAGATNGTVTVTEILPAGLTATSFSGTGWTCNLAPLTATRNDILAPGDSYPDLTLMINVSANAPASVINKASVSGGGEIITTNDIANDPTTINQLADLTITKTHIGNFTQGQTGAIYTIKVTNNGTGATNGTVSVTDTLPAGLTATGFDGTGWTCNLATLTATRDDILASGASYPDLTLMVDVDANVSVNIINTASVSGGGDIDITNNSVDDPTTINQLADLTITKTHTGNFTQGQTGAIYTIKVTNNGTGATNGTVSVTDTLPAGLTATGFNGTGWTCNLATLTATRDDILASGASYPDLTLRVNVAANVPTSVTNVASVSGGGEIITTNDAANDPTTINQLADLTITMTHTGNFTQWQSGAKYTIKVTNYGAGATSGTVTVIDSLPAGLTATGFNGTGWTCNLATLTAIRNDILSSGESYPDLMLTVNVAANAPVNVTNCVTVSGGSEIITENNSASDLTTIASEKINPVINFIKPLSGDSVNINTGSLIIVKFSDPEPASGIDYTSLQVKLDDGDWTTVNLTGETLYYLVKLPLKNGTHTISFKVKDNAGNETTQAVTFNWDNYRHGFGFGRFSF